jgi:hypothetical protein
MPRGVELYIAHRELRKIVKRAIEDGEIRMELKCGADLDPHAVHATQFTLDKRKYSIRFSDETEESVKVWIERKE